ncbi:MAG: hypothetical protein IPH49_08660 [Ignavibacteria bacterium]|nr:hypothetical protein [Ignavibacteria bacterium]
MTMLLGMFLPNYCIAGVLLLVLPLAWGYEFDASRANGRGLSDWSGTAPIVITTAKRSYLGPFGNDSIRLSVTDLPEHDTIVIDLLLYILGSWDGVEDDDRMLITLDTRDTVFFSTFSNTLFQQNFPSPRGGKQYARRTGAAEIDVTGWIFSEPKVFNGPLDAGYTLSFRMPHTASVCRLDLIGALKDVRPIPSNEAWGVGSARIGVVPKEKPPPQQEEPTVYPGR